MIAVLTHLGHEFDSESEPELQTSRSPSAEAHKAVHKAFEAIRHGSVDVKTDT